MYKLGAAVATISMATGFFVLPAAARVTEVRPVAQIQQVSTSEVQQARQARVLQQSRAMQEYTKAKQLAQQSRQRGYRLINRAFWWAVSRKGHPYVWGGTGPYGYDCSGLVYAAYRHFGHSYFGRTTYAMLSDGGLRRVSHPVRGDLAFFGSGHVEFFVHWGETFGAQEPGTPVWWHRYGGGWRPTSFFAVRGSWRRLAG